MAETRVLVVDDEQSMRELLGIMLRQVGYAVTLALSDQGLSSFTLPVGALIIILLIAFLIGVIAAIRPARRAAKLDVLRAVTVE